jgi:hypothetical protein
MSAVIAVESVTANRSLRDRHSSSSAIWDQNFARSTAETVVENCSLTNSMFSVPRHGQLL